MSLNHKEIDLALSELDLVGAQIQKIVQPSYDTLSLSVYQPGHASTLLICTAHGACRIHETRTVVPKPPKPLRFAELLKSRIVNGRIREIRQLGAERIVRLRITTLSGDYRLYARLWSGAGNIILTDETGLIIDAMARKLSRDENSGGRYAPEESLPEGPPEKIFVVRDLPGDGSFNERVDDFYSGSGSHVSREKLLERLRGRFERQQAILEARIVDLRHVAREYSDPERFRELGDILMAHTGDTLAGKFLEADDFFRGGTVRIEVDMRKSVVENARHYYERHRKAVSGESDVAAEILAAQKSITELESERVRLEGEENPFILRAALDHIDAPKHESGKGFNGISLERSGWTILVGRSGKENDELLRHHARGNDFWLHARDYAGAYVFIRSRAGKTVPLDILIDCGTLALYYSKGRAAGKGDLYYTQVKYLRRAKNGPLGLVIPTQEKNLRIQIDENRLRELKALIGQES